MVYDRLAIAGRRVRSHWRRLERDWRSVVVGAAIVTAVAALGVDVPW